MFFDCNITELIVLKLVKSSIYWFIGEGKDLWVEFISS